MKKINLLLLIFILIENTLFSQISQCIWAEKGESNNFIGTSAISTDSSGNVISSGYFYGNTLTFGSFVLTNTDLSKSTCDAYIVKHDSSGNFLWANKVGGLKEENILSIVTDVDGNIYLLGTYTSTSVTIGTMQFTNSGGYNNMFLFKLDPQGNIVWAKSSSGIYSETGKSLKIDKTNNLVLLGTFNSPSFTFDNATYTNTNGSSFLFKINLDGTTLWGEIFSGDEASELAVSTDNSIYIGGTFVNASLTLGTIILNNNGTSTRDVFIAKTDENGNFIDGKSFGGAYDEAINDLALDFEGNFIVTGGFMNGSSTNIDGDIYQNVSSQSYNADYFIAKFNSSNVLLWSKHVGSTGNDYGRHVVTDSNGNIYVTGYFGSSGFNMGNGSLSFGAGTAMFTAMYSKTGVPIVSRSIKTNSNFGSASICLDKDWNVYINGIYAASSVLFGANNVQLTTTPSQGSFIDNFFIAKFKTILTTPLFNTFQPICEGSTNVALPLTSLNNITGFWIPAQINSSILGASIYTFVPDSGQSAIETNVEIHVNPNPLVDAGSDVVLCEGDSLLLNATSNILGDTIIYTWENGFSNGIQFIPLIDTTSLSVNGVNTLTGCSDTDEINIIVNSNPIINAGEDKFVCEGSEVTIFATGGNNYIWNNGVIDGVPFVQSSPKASYNVIGTDENGCVGVDSITVNLEYPPVASFTFFINNGFVETTNTSSGGNLSYLWNYSNGVQSALENLMYNLNENESNTITLTVENDCGIDINSQSYDIGLTKENGYLVNSLYPNPFKDQLIVKFNKIDNFTIEIYDLVGKIIFNGKYSCDFIFIDTKDFESGNYLLKYYNDQISNSKFINKQ